MSSQSPPRNLIARDAYDVAAFARATRASPALRETIATGSRLLPDFDAFAEDLFALLFKYQVEPRAAAPVSAALRAQLLDTVRTTAGFDVLRAGTVLDELRAGAGCLRLARHALRLLRDPELFSREELLAPFEAKALEDELAERQADAASLEEMRAAQGEIGKDGAPGDAGEGEPADAPGSAGAGQGTADRVARALRGEISELEEALEALRRAQTRRLERLPAKVESDLRHDVSGLGEALEEEDADVDAIAAAVGGAGASVPAQDRWELGERLTQSEKLRDLARVVGAFKEVALAARRRRFERRAAEVHDVERGGALERVLASELVALRHPLLRRDFQRRLLERTLLGYAVEARDRAGRGPMVVCIDGSGSMRGVRELWAKAVALALLDIARKQRRAFHALVFSASVQATRGFALTREERPGFAPSLAWPALVEFAEYFPGGGTRFEPVLDAAAELISSSAGMRRGDIVFVTDGEAALRPAWCAEFSARRDALGFRLHGVHVDLDRARPAHGLASLADTMLRVSELSEGAARSLFAAV